MLFPEGFANFMSLVRRDGEHLVWIGAKSHEGYGRMRFKGKVRFAHRVSYTFEHGSVPEGHVIVTTCGFRLCVLPSHLEAIPRKEFAKRPRPGATTAFKKYGPTDLFLNKKYRDDPKWRHLMLRNLPWRTARLRGEKPPKCRCHGTVLYKT